MASIQKCQHIKHTFRYTHRDTYSHGVKGNWLWRRMSHEQNCSSLKQCLTLLTSATQTAFSDDRITKKPKSCEHDWVSEAVRHLDAQKIRVTLCDPVSNLCGILETILNERLNKIQWGIRGSVGFFCLFFSLQDSKTFQICRCLKILQGFTKRDETTEEGSRAGMTGTSLLYVWGGHLPPRLGGKEGRVSRLTTSR